MILFFTTLFVCDLPRYLASGVIDLLCTISIGKANRAREK